MTCQQVQTNLSLYLYGELDFAQEDALERRIAQVADGIERGYDVCGYRLLEHPQRMGRIDRAPVGDADLRSLDHQCRHAGQRGGQDACSDEINLTEQ